GVWSGGKAASTPAWYTGRLAPPGIPKTFVTPSAFSDSISASAALIEPTMLPTRLRLRGRRLARVPAGPRVDSPLERAALVGLEDPEDRLDQLLAEEFGLQAEIEQVRVHRVVVVLFLL